MKLNRWWGLILFLIVLMTSCENDENIIVDSGNSDTISNIVSLEEARAELEQLLNDTYGWASTTSTRSTSSGRKVIANAFTIREDLQLTRSSGIESPIIHIFNFENQGGFAIMSGNREMPSLLALADLGEISETNPIDNPGFALFLENMEKKYIEGISASVSTRSSGNYKVYGEWKNIIYKEGGYCKVKWNQSSPYNNYCPLKNKERTVTGCVATAVAQLMSIYKYPSSHNGYLYDWNKMTADAYGYNCTLAGQDQIARLMVELGSKPNLNMSYNTATNGGSSASADNIPRTLKNFGYSNGGSLNSYNTERVVSELKNGYSVLAGGFSHKKVKKFLGIKVKTTYSGGHRWLCHGLLERRRIVKTYNSNNVLQNTTTESEWYPLCNWGWGGSQDGYYLSEAFNSNAEPSYSASTRSTDGENGSEDYNYQYKITAVVGIRK